MSGQGEIVTIDGPSGAGKSTISRLLAAALGYTYLDTGAMYRAVGYRVEELGLDLANAEGLRGLLADFTLQLLPGADDTRVILNGEDISRAIRTPEMGMMASRVSALGLVREKLVRLQQELGRQGRVVAEGRDTGTVVFPEAGYKFFLDASAEERAERRRKQLEEKGQTIEYDEILAQIVKRDHDDSVRALSPLRPAADAIIVDSSAMNIEQVIAFMRQCIAKPQSTQA